MKKIYALFPALLLAFYLPAQSFNSPESVEYDGPRNRWIVGQNGSGEVHVYSPASSSLSNFAAVMLATGPHGIEQLGDTIYACDGGYIRGFNANTGAMVVNINLSASFLNGLTTDGGHFLFATDFSAKKIYRINTITQTFNLMNSTVKTPNGIIYDGANNRCVFVTWGSAAPVQAISLADSSISTLLATSLSNCDGITRDLAGYWYVTSWGTNALNRIDPLFSAAPVSVMTGLSSPADIDITTAGDSIGIPNSGNANNVVFYTGITTGIAPVAAPHEMECYPVPAVNRVNITSNEAVIGGRIVLMDISGREILSQAANGYAFYLDRENLPAGVYSVRLMNNEGQTVSVQKIIFCD